MKKIIVLLVYLFSTFFCSLLSAQSGWFPVEKGIYPPHVLALCPYDSVLFVAGGFDSAGGISANDIAQWNGINWAPLGGGVKEINGHIWSLAIYHGKLYAGGQYDSAGGVATDGIAVWNGVNWAPVGNWTRNDYATVRGMTVYNDELYVTGSFDSAGIIPVNNIAKWNDTIWAPVGSGFTGFLAEGLCFAVYNRKLYLAGTFDTISNLVLGNKGIVSWDGTQWDSVGGNTFYGGISALLSYDSLLFNGGIYFDDGFHRTSINFIAQWNDSLWDPVVPSFGTSAPTEIFALGLYGRDVIAGGMFDSAGGIAASNVARWNGLTWSSMDSGTNGWVWSFAVYNGDLYAGGEFGSAGGRTANGIAVWGNNTLTGVNSLPQKVCTTVFPNPSNGSFTLSLSNITEKCNVEIFNVLGEKVLTETLQPQTPKGALNEINLSSQPNGIYLYRVMGENGSLVGEGKIAIER